MDKEKPPRRRRRATDEEVQAQQNRADTAEAEVRELKFQSAMTGMDQVHNAELKKRDAVIDRLREQRRRTQEITVDFEDTKTGYRVRSKGLSGELSGTPDVLKSFGSHIGKEMDHLHAERIQRARSQPLTKTLKYGFFAAIAALGIYKAPDIIKAFPHESAPAAGPLRAGDDESSGRRAVAEDMLQSQQTAVEDDAARPAVASPHAGSIEQEARSGAPVGFRGLWRKDVNNHFEVRYVILEPDTAGIGANPVLEKKYQKILQTEEKRLGIDLTVREDMTRVRIKDADIASGRPIKIPLPEGVGAQGDMRDVVMVVAEVNPNASDPDELVVRQTDWQAKAGAELRSGFPVWQK